MRSLPFTPSFSPSSMLEQMETFAQVSDKDNSDKSFVQYDATGRSIAPDVYDPENQGVRDEIKRSPVGF